MRKDASVTRFDLAAVGLALVLPSLTTWAYFFQADSASAGVQLLLFNVLKVAQFLLPIVWVCLVQRQRVNWKPRDGQGVVWGAVFGLIVAGSMGVLYWWFVREAAWFAPAAAEIREKLTGLSIDTPVKFALMGLFYSLCHSLLEEYYWRWFVFGQLQRHMRQGWAIAISAIGFMAHHILVLGKFFGFDHEATWALSLCVAVGGAVWAWLYARTNSLLGPWLSHLLVDAAIFAIGYHVARQVL